MVSQEDLNRVMKTVAQAHKAFLANGFFLPDWVKNKRLAFPSKQMLIDVLEGRCHLPKRQDVSNVTIADPPPATYLRDELVRVIEENTHYENQAQA